MRVIAFPGGDGTPPRDTWAAELDAALSGEAEGPAADAWRELRKDVRSLAPPMSPELTQRLERELALPAAGSGQKRQPKRLLVHLRALGRPQLAGAGALATALMVAVAAIVIGVGGFGGTRESSPTAEKALPAQSRPDLEAAGGSFASGAVASPAPASPTPTSPGAASPGAASPGAASPGAAAPGRVQQLAASISLSATAADVQAISDGVARLAVGAEGFVESSHVQVQQHGSSEATLTLRLPSARLSAALAAIGRLAPVSAESQSLQDITNAYDAARQRLADAVAERQALLRALARATTEGQIDSLRERLSQARGAIAQARASLQAVSQRASTAEVEVTVLGDSHAASEGLTLHRGLHDAGRVLTVALVVLLIGAAVLVPLALLLAALAGAHRVWRRHSRERALDAS